MQRVLHTSWARSASSECTPESKISLPSHPPPTHGGHSRAGTDMAGWSFCSRPCRLAISRLGRDDLAGLEKVTQILALSLAHAAAAGSRSVTVSLCECALLTQRWCIGRTPTIHTATDASVTMSIPNRTPNIQIYYSKGRQQSKEISIHPLSATAVDSSHFRTVSVNEGPDEWRGGICSW
jgi:hypothetical protein